VVITAKHPLTARLSLEGVGLSADELFADAHGPEKSEVLKALGAVVYVGDTPADAAAAVAAGAHAVGVTTGEFTAQDLHAAGAAHVLSSLTDFPALYRELSARRS
jgi:phosphoglycolate phosphatase